MEYSKTIIDGDASLTINQNESQTPVEVCAANEGEGWGNVALTEGKAFEAALALVEATGVSAGNHYDVATAEEAESNAAYWLERAVEMRAEESEKAKKYEERKQEIRDFMTNVLGYDVVEPNVRDYEKYLKAVEWAESREKNEVIPRTLKYADAENADKSVTWITNTSPATGLVLEFFFNKEKACWYWYDPELGTYPYTGEHLGKLLRGYFPMTEKLNV